MLEFDLHGKRSNVALLAVDKAFYGLHADNKLTAKQVTMVTPHILEVILKLFYHTIQYNTQIQAVSPTFQVFSSMELLDSGCPYSGGYDPASVLTDAGLTFVSDSKLEWKKSMTKERLFYIYMLSVQMTKHG